MPNDFKSFIRVISHTHTFQKHLFSVNSIIQMDKMYPGEGKGLFRARFASLHLHFQNHSKQLKNFAELTIYPSVYSSP